MVRSKINQVYLTERGKELQRLSTKVTSKGQVTIPVEVRRLLGIGPHDVVDFKVEEARVSVERSRGSVVERTAGVLGSDGSPEEAAELRNIAEYAIAEETVERSGA